DEHIVLDPYATQTRHVRARLDREHHSGVDCSIRGIVGPPPADPWILVYFDPEAVARSVAEGIAQPARLERAPRDTVDRKRRHARLDRVNRAIVGLEDRRVKLAG